MSKEFIVFNRIEFLLSAIGLTISGYLLYTYLNSAPIICLNTGCEQVRASQYSYFLSIPLPAYGAVMYLGVLVATFLKVVLSKEFFKPIARIVLALSALGLAVSAYLTFLEAFVIKAYCMWCLSSAAIVTLLLITSAIENRRLK